MALTIGVILALLGLAVAAYPFVRGRWLGPTARADDAPEPEDAGTSGDEGRYADALDAIYQSIRTLQLERELGNVPEGLYREQLNAYRLQAAALLRDREQGQSGVEGEALEEEIRLARAGLFRPAGRGTACPNCARPVPAGAENCPECGVALTAPTLDDATAAESGNPD